MSVPPSAWACCSCSKKTGAVAPGGAVISCIRSSPCRELRRSLVFEPHDILRRDVEISVVVERVGDGGGDQAREGQGGQPPNIPDQGETQHRAQSSYDHSRAGILRHVDRPETAERPFIATPLHVPPRIEV